MIRVAVLADIHGNLPTLEAVLVDIEATEADLIVGNGDLAGGPCPTQTLDPLEKRGRRAIWLRGNGDRGSSSAGVVAFDTRTPPPTRLSAVPRRGWRRGRSSGSPPDR